MTEIDLQKALINRFNTLNTFSGITFIKKNNVHYPNKPFTENISSWFDLNFLSNAPSSVSVGDDSQNRYNGIFQIDIYTPLDMGEDEPNNKYKWLSKLFSKGTDFDNIIIMKVYRARVVIPAAEVLVGSTAVAGDDLPHALHIGLVVLVGNVHFAQDLGLVLIDQGPVIGRNHPV